MTPVISVTGLTRRYPGQVALDDVHLTIGTGTITGLLGRNGAGKTTLLQAAALFENVVVIDRGRVVLDAAADGLRGAVTTVSGPVLAVDSFTKARPVWERRGLGSQASVVMVGQIAPEDRERARSLGLDLTPLSLQQLVVYASGGPAVAGSLTERTSA